MTTSTGPVSTTEIAALLAWARSLSEARGSADPAQRAAYQAAKTALLARITDQHSRLSTEDTA
jgi:hypothetical protein